MFANATKLAKRSGWLLMVVGLLSGGCSGINATKSFSPLDFFLPGLGGFGHNQRQPTAPPLEPDAAPAEQPTVLVAGS